MAPSLFWAKMGGYLCFASGAVFTSVLVFTLLTEHGCADTPTVTHVADSVLYAILAAALALTCSLFVKGAFRWVRANVRATSWKNTVGAGLLVMLPAMLGLALDIALGGYFFIADISFYGCDML